MSASEGDYFGSTVTPAPAGTPPPSLPVASSGAPRSTALVVVGAVLLVAALGSAYWFFYGSRSAIELPDQLLGLERIDADSALGQQLDDAGEQYSGAWTGDLEIAGYGDVDQFAVVIAGQVDEVRGGPEDFFTGLDQGLAISGQKFAFTKEDAGSKGGDLRCTVVPAQQAALCAWTNNDIVGIVALSGSLATDSANATREIRDQIER